MPKTIKYTGTQIRWPELAVTGKQSVWNPGQQEERADAEAALLLATRKFEPVATVALTATPDQAAAFPGVVSGGGNGMNTVLIGHSYLDQESQTYSYNRPALNLQGTAIWMNYFLGWPLEFVRNHGVGGERMIDLRDRLADALDEPAVLAIWNIGINDLKLTKNNFPKRYNGDAYPVDPNQSQLEYVVAYAKEFLTKIANKYGRVIIFPETSPGNGAGDQTKHLAARTAQYNRALMQHAASDSRMLYIPLDTITWNPTSAAGDIATGPGGESLYLDQIHPGNYASCIRGKFAAKLVKPWLSKVDRLPTNVFETYSNLKLVGTSLVSQGSTLRVFLPNLQASTAVIRISDTVCLSVPAAGQSAWDGRFKVVGESTTYIDVACSVPGSYTGTINVSTAEQLFDNPLFTVQTGGTAGGAGSLTGTMPANTSTSLPAGAACTVTYAPHTDIDGVADGLGSWMQVALTLPANAEVGFNFLCHRTNVGSPYHGRVFAGDAVQAGFDFEMLTVPANISTVEFQCISQVTPNGGTSTSLIASTHYKEGTNTARYPEIAHRGSAMTAEWQLPIDSLVTSLDGSIFIRAGAAPATISFRVGRVGVYVLRQVRRNLAKALDI